ncbi:MAG: class I SAM-dependent methyltransferase [Planctomycetes bacterium]|nr:class I SAM-dependent methyltransferase [Planctomycetota bacterium]MCP4840022.1 class I SAM-dependent methyltransferase [Planctomycetota bacterium]
MPESNSANATPKPHRQDYKGVSINGSKNTRERVFGLISNSTGSRVVDVPCGSGVFIQRLKDHGFDDVVGIDIQNSMGIEHEAFLRGDITERLSLEAGSVDDGIEYIARQRDFVREIERILRPGGEFIVSTPNIIAIRSRWLPEVGCVIHGVSGLPVEIGYPGLIALPWRCLVAFAHVIHHDSDRRLPWVPRHRHRARCVPAAAVDLPSISSA